VPARSRLPEGDERLGTLADVAKRDPHDVLGVSAGSSLQTVKAAWRRLARENHPDLTGDDPAASRLATRRMAEINDAYESLRRSDAAERRANGEEPATAGFGEAAPRGGPPRPRPTRPVTGRVDTSETFRPRNATTGRGSTLGGQPPRPPSRADREPPRASQPTGPLERGRIHRFRAPSRPPLADARAHEMAFGKFHGHTLGEIEAFEPSYIDWLATAITRDRDLVAKARVIRDDLDSRGVVRRSRPERAQPGRSA
jgi:curved DNA-binding protein CbpA